ncbi:hypothetical protein [Xenorhabdus bovienii]|uniref:hypothetical protein n=1 Tax=Xenorhabdus bovienii TaxID=40576 RepID=UPI0023B322E2|nr:hypothetical protein [Xenorhabdus bovienii]
MERNEPHPGRKRYLITDNRCDSSVDLIDYIKARKLSSGKLRSEKLKSEKPFPSLSSVTACGKAVVGKNRAVGYQDYDRECIGFLAY